MYVCAGSKCSQCTYILGTLTLPISSLMSSTFICRNLDQHFMPMFHLCNPCAVNYTFYGNFHSMTDDISQVLHEIGAPQWLYHARSEHSTLSMKEMMNLYFGQVPPGERTKLKEEFTKRTGFSFEAAPDEE